MTNYPEKRKSALGSETAESVVLDELRAAREAALQLMEEAVFAKRRSDELIEKLRDEITDRKRVEDALRSTEEQFRLLSESFHDYAIITLNILGELTSWNPGAEQMFGYSEGEIIGRNARILFVPEDRERGLAEREMETARVRGRATDERWHLRKDGTRFYASGIMAPLREGEKLVGFAKIARDLTEQKLLEAELFAHRENLERLVAGRTLELEEANQSLLWEMDERRKSEDERVVLLRRLVTMQEDERRRFARDIHDSLGQQLTALRLKLASLKDEPSGGPLIRSGLEQLQNLGAKIDAEVNFLVWELRPTVLDDLGLVAAIENYVREWISHYGIFVEFHTGRFVRGRLDPDVETSLYRIMQEALNNIYKHARATSANILLEVRGHEVVLVIEDDGRGFDIESARPKPGTGGGLGLLGMRERAAILGGTVDIESTPGSGTTVYVRVPVDQPSGETELGV